MITNNLVLALLTFAVRLGTLYPIVARVLDGSGVTVGPSPPLKPQAAARPARA